MKTGKNTSFLRELNQKNILSLIKNKPISRSELARLTGLTKPAVSSIVEILLNNNFIEEIGVKEIARGRSPELLALKKDAHYAIGVDISRRGCKVGICDFTGNRLFSKEVKIDTLPPVIAVKKISVAIHELLLSENIPDNKLLGLGISVPGPVDPIEGQILKPPNFSLWHNFKIVEQFKKEFDILTMVENDSTAHALAENLFGHGKEFDNYFMVVMVDGVGSALVLDGKPYRGQRGLNPEIGHATINIHGDQCQCGKKGCLELYTSIPQILAKAQEEGMNYESWEQITDCALEQDKNCIKIIREQADYLALAVGNIASIFAPEAVIFSGRIQYKPDLLLNFITNTAYEKTISKGSPIPRILVSELIDNKEILAATSIIFSDILYM